MAAFSSLLPRLSRILTEVGENIKLARLRRKLSVQQVAERAGIGRNTLTSIEKGSPSVGLGNYAQVLLVLGLEKDLLKIAVDDILGRKIQDAGLKVGNRAPKRNFRMAKTRREVLVYAHWEPMEAPLLMGILYSDLLRGKEVFSFEYEPLFQKLRSN